MVIQFYPGAEGGRAAGHTALEHRRGDRLDFDPHQLAHFRSALLEQRRFRFEQLQQLGADEPAASEQLGEVTAALRTAAEAALSDIDGALARLRDGSYGRCLACRRPILPERLEILPATAMCMPCQQAAEVFSG